MKPSLQELTYRLRGRIGDRELSFRLETDQAIIGSLSTSEIELPTAGVSRRHARIQHHDGRFEIQDLDSKNGTYVNGRRVESSPFHDGDELRFGPVRLTFEALHPGDTELAIRLSDTGPRATTALALQETPFLPAGLDGGFWRHWMQLAGAFLELLPRGPQEAPAEALRFLVDQLQLQGACLLECPPDEEPLVVAASGKVDHGIERARQASREAELDEPRVLFDAVADSPLTLALLRRREKTLILALCGSFAARRDSEPLLLLLLAQAERTRPIGEPQDRPSLSEGFPGLSLPQGFVLARSEKMRRIYGLMETLAQGDLPILVIGETGAGKEFLAQILHRSSPRRHEPFVAINCAAIPAELLEAELFGIGDGVATGVTARKGRFQLADGGTLFLDEIGDMSADLQAKLLRALQEKEVHPLGKKPLRVDVRVLAATNQQLHERIQEGSFRADLYYRLAGYVLELPPLRDRPEDVADLVEHFVRECATELGKPIRGLTVRALKLLVGYNWPGNVRELQNEARRLVYLCPPGKVIDSSNLSPLIVGHPEASNPPVKADPAEQAPSEPSTATSEAPLFPLDSLDLEQLESRALTEALRRCGGNQVQAAKLLGISRQKLRRRMERFGQLKPKN